MLRGNKVNKIITSKPKRKRGLRPDRSLPSIQIIKRDPPAGIKELWVQSIEKKGVFVIRDPPPPMPPDSALQSTEIRRKLSLFYPSSHDSAQAHSQISGELGDGARRRSICCGGGGGRHFLLRPLLGYLPLSQSSFWSCLKKQTVINYFEQLAA